MLIRDDEDLDPVKTQIFDLLVGFDDEKNIEAQKTHSQRLLKARRAIEQRQEQKELSSYFDEDNWFND